MSKQQLSALVPPRKRDKVRRAVVTGKQGAGFRQKNPIEEQLEATQNTEHRTSNTDAQHPASRTTTITFKGKQIIIGVLRKKETTTWPQALELIKTLNTQHQTNFTLIRPEVADHLLVKTQNWKQVTDALPSIINALIAYEAPEKPLSEQIIYAHENEPRVIISTGKHKGKTDIALFLPNLTANDVKKQGNDFHISVPDSRLIVIPDFPVEDGWYKPYAETTVPHGKEFESSIDEVRYLWRVDSSFVGFLARVYWRFVVLNGGPSVGFGVAIEIKPKDLKKFEKIVKP